MSPSLPQSSLSIALVLALVGPPALAGETWHRVSPPVVQKGDDTSSDGGRWKSERTLSFEDGIVSQHDRMGRKKKGEARFKNVLDVVSTARLEGLPNTWTAGEAHTVAVVLDQDHKNLDYPGVVQLEATLASPALELVEFASQLGMDEAVARVDTARPADRLTCTFRLRADAGEQFQLVLSVPSFGTVTTTYRSEGRAPAPVPPREEPRRGNPGTVSSRGGDRSSAPPSVARAPKLEPSDPDTEWSLWSLGPDLALQLDDNWERVEPPYDGPAFLWRLPQGKGEMPIFAEVFLDPRPASSTDDFALLDERLNSFYLPNDFIVMPPVDMHRNLDWPNATLVLRDITSVPGFPRYLLNERHLTACVTESTLALLVVRIPQTLVPENEAARNPVQGGLIPKSALSEEFRERAVPWANPGHEYGFDLSPEYYVEFEGDARFNDTRDPEAARVFRRSVPGGHARFVVSSITLAEYKAMGADPGEFNLDTVIREWGWGDAQPLEGPTILDGDPRVGVALGIHNGDARGAAFVFEGERSLVVDIRAPRSARDLVWADVRRFAASVWIGERRATRGSSTSSDPDRARDEPKTSHRPGGMPRPGRHTSKREPALPKLLPAMPEGNIWHLPSDLAFWLPDGWFRVESDGPDYVWMRPYGEQVPSFAEIHFKRRTTTPAGSSGSDASQVLLEGFMDELVGERDFLEIGAPRHDVMFGRPTMAAVLRELPAYDGQPPEELTERYYTGWVTADSIAMLVVRVPLQHVALRMDEVALQAGFAPRSEFPGESRPRAIAYSSYDGFIDFESAPDYFVPHAPAAIAGWGQDGSQNAGSLRRHVEGGVVTFDLFSEPRDSFEKNYGEFSADALIEEAERLGYEVLVRPRLVSENPQVFWGLVKSEGELSGTAVVIGPDRVAVLKLLGPLGSEEILTDDLARFGGTVRIVPHSTGK